MKKLIFIAFLPLSLHVNAQETAPLWNDFTQNKQSDKTTVLPDFSYAGYQFSEKVIPEIKSKKHFNVIDFGAIPNDNKHDDEAIQKAIRAAENYPGGGVVFFPAGKFLISPDEDKDKFISITKSHIVLKGSGSNSGGTEIFQDKMRVGSRQFRFSPEENNTKKITTVVKDAPRESFWIEVADASGLKTGQNVTIRHRSEEYTRWYFAPLELDTDWTRLFGKDGGMNIHEIHTIEKIEGKKVKFKNPLHLDIKMVKSASFDLYTFRSIRECGIEDILFTSNWKNYPEEFVHHKDGIHDSGWITVGMEYIEDSWIRNCEFRDLNEAIVLRAGFKVSIIDNKFTGKKGHTSVHARAGYGVLIKNCEFNGSHHHGPGTGYGGTNTVVTQCKLGIDQNIDSHSGQPYATLFDDIIGGVFYNLGGPLPGLPHHGRQMVFWNFGYLSNKDYHYNFWDMEKRRNNTMAYPIFVGFQPNVRVTFENEGVDQLRGKRAEPQSLFEAQLRLRLNNTSAKTK